MEVMYPLVRILKIDAWEIFAPEIFVVIVAAVGAGVDSCQILVALDGGNAPGIIGIFYHSISLSVKDPHHIALQILHIGIDRVAVLRPITHRKAQRFPIVARSSFKTHGIFNQSACRIIILVCIMHRSQ